MKIDGFTYIRNGFKMGYPFISSIQSLLPIVDKLIVVVGNSEDGTKKAIENLMNPKIIIIDNIWTKEKRINGAIFREQSNIGLNRITGDWAIHIQADEVLHESAKEKFIKYIKIADKFDDVDGLLFPFYHFWGDYKHIRQTRRTHAFDFNAVDKLELFNATHPIYMKEVISKQNWDFKYDPSKSNMSFRDKILHKIEKRFNDRLFEYKNYKIKRLPTQYNQS